MGDATIKVLLVDDHQVVRRGLRTFLEIQPDIEVVGEAGDGGGGVELAESLRPDVVLMDVSMPGVDGVEATYELKTRCPDLTVLMLSIGNKEQEIQAGLAGGAAEYLVKGAPATEIVDAIKRHGSLAERR